MKEQARNTEVQINEEEIGNLSEKDFPAVRSHHQPECGIYHKVDRDL